MSNRKTYNKVQFSRKIQIMINNYKKAVIPDNIDVSPNKYIFSCPYKY